MLYVSAYVVYYSQQSRINSVQFSFARSHQGVYGLVLLLVLDGHFITPLLTMIR